MRDVRHDAWVTDEARRECLRPALVLECTKRTKTNPDRRRKRDSVTVMAKKLLLMWCSVVILQEVLSYIAFKQSHSVYDWNIFNDDIFSICH